jgi:oligosaccharide repeat unit polymerase
MDTILFVKSIFITIIFLYICITIINWKKIDVFSPLYIFPVAYIIYLYIGSLESLQDEFIISGRQWSFYLIGLIFFYLGCSFPLLKSIIYKKDNNICKRLWDQNRLIIITLGIFLFAVIARVMIYLSSGIPLFSKNIFITRLKSIESGYIAEIGMSTEIVFMVSLAGLVLFKKRRLLFIIMILVSFGLSLFTGTRTSLIRQLIPGIVLYNYMVKKISMRTITIIVLICLIFIGSMNFFRYYQIWGSLVTEDLSSREYRPAYYWLYYVFHDFKTGPEGFARILEIVPNEHKYQYGRLHILPFLFPLPGNQPQPGEVLKNMAGLEFPGIGLAATMLASQYVDFGLPGIILGMFLIGISFEYLYILAKRKKHPFYYLVYGSFLITFILGIRTNYINFEILWTVLLLVAVHWYAGRKEI